MKRQMNIIAISGLALGSLLMGACTTSAKSTEVQTSGMHQISALYVKATAQNQHRAVRKPVRDAQARAMRLMAAKAEQLAAETQAWDTDARLISEDANEQNVIRTTVVSFRESLQQLKEAAAMSDTVAVRKYYSDVSASYRQLAKLTNIDQ